MSGRQRRAPGYFLLHLVAGETMTAVIPSQVIDHAESQAIEGGADAPGAVAVGILEPIRVAVSRPLRERIREFKRRAPHVRMVLLPFSGRARAQSAALLARKVASLAGGRPTVFHCRGEEAVLWATELAEHLRRRGHHVSIVADIRGAWPDEFLLLRGYGSPSSATPSSLVRYDYHVGRLRDALRQADAIMTVSDPLAAWLEHHWGGVNVTVVPCSVSAVAFSAEARAAARLQLGIADDAMVFAYVGSVTKYQHLAEGALAFLKYAMELDPTVRFLAVTNDPAAFQDLISAADLPRDRCTVVSLPQASVPSVLCAADVGLLLRAPSRVNEVSMPVKLGEYLSCGVPVLVSRIAGWVDQIVDDAGAGVAVSWFGVSDDTRRQEAARTVARFRVDRLGFRERALALCRDRFVWSAHTARVRRAYAASLALAMPQAPAPERGLAGAASSSQV